MKIDRSIQCGISYKEDYKYVWDEQTNLIFYQNSMGNLILGLSTHAGMVSEMEIKKLFEFSLKWYSIMPFGSGPSICLNCKIFVENFYSIVVDNKGNNRVNDLMKGHFVPLEPNSIIHENGTFEVQLFTNLIDSGLVLPNICEVTDFPAYWDFDISDDYSVAVMVTNVNFKILTCLYDIGITRKVCNSNGDYVEDINNKELLKFINYYFSNNLFEVVEQREENVNTIYSIAHEENIKYDECISHLEEIIINNLDNNKKLVKNPVFYAQLYKKITGKPYDFVQNIERILANNPSMQKRIKRDICRY